MIMTDTPKSKAFEILSKYCGKDCTITNIKKQKRNAKICVNEILKMPFEFESERAFWKEVKKEINIF